MEGVSLQTGFAVVLPGVLGVSQLGANFELMSQLGSSQIMLVGLRRIPDLPQDGHLFHLCLQQHSCIDWSVWPSDSQTKKKAFKCRYLHLRSSLSIQPLVPLLPLRVCMTVSQESLGVCRSLWYVKATAPFFYQSYTVLVTQTRCSPTQRRKHPQPYPIMFTLWFTRRLCCLKPRSFWGWPTPVQVWVSPFTHRFPGWKTVWTYCGSLVLTSHSALV